MKFVLESPPLSATVLINKVKSCLNQGKYEEALEYIVQTEISKSVDKKEEQNLILYKIEGYIGITYFKEARELTKTITNQRLNLRNYSILIQAYIFEVECCRNLQLFDEASDTIEKLDKIFKKLSSSINTENSDLFAKYNFIKAHLLQSTGRLQDAIKIYLIAKSIVQTINDRLFLQKILVNLASAYWEINDLEQSHKLCMQALAIKTTEESYLTISKCLNLLGLISQDKNNISTALNFYNQSLNLKYKLGNRVEIAKTLHSIGYVNKLLEKYEESITALQECYNIFEELENYSEMSILQNDMGFLFLKQGEVLQAQKNFKTALNLSLKVKNEYLSARNYYSLSKLFLLKNDIKNALSYTEQALELRKNIPNDLELGETYLLKGLIHFIEKNHKLTIENLSRAESCFKRSKNKLSIIRAEVVQIIYYDHISNNGQINNVLSTIIQTIDKVETKELRLLQNLGEAIVLKQSKRLKSKAKALKIFRNVGHNLKIDPFFNEYALLQELRLLLYEYSLLRDENVLDDINICITKLFNLSETNNQFLLRIHLYRLRAKISLLLEGIDEAIIYLEQAFLFAQSKNLSGVIPQLQSEYESLDKKISYWNAFKKRRRIVDKDLKKIGLTEIINEILDGKIILYV